MARHAAVRRTRSAIVRRVLIIVAAVATAAAAAAAGGCAHYISPPGPAVPDRPGYTDAPTALPAGAVQVEAGYTYDRAGAVEYTAIGETLLRLGVGARTELRLFANSYAIRSTSGFPADHGMEDPKVGIKTNLRAIPDSVHSAVPNLAAFVAVTVPVGADAFSATRAQPEAKLAANWTTPTPFSVYSNAGVGGVYDGSRWGERGWISVALWYSVNPRVSVFGEGILVRSLGGTALPSNNVDAGITYLINDRFQVDLRAGRGFGSVSGSERFLGAGFARRW
jgi:hypothetical protein